MSINLIEEDKRVLDFRSALADLNLYHDIDMPLHDFYEMGMRAWLGIKNREYVPYILLNQPVDEDGFIDIPCNAFDILGVTVDHYDNNIINDRLSRTTLGSYRRSINYSNSNLSGRISAKAVSSVTDDLQGTYIPFELQQDEDRNFAIKITSEFTKVNILYIGVLVDGDGMPLINSKESKAIMLFCALCMKEKMYYKGLAREDMVNRLEKNYHRAVRNARVQAYFTQNHLDSMLNVSTSMDRKSYNRSFKVFKDI